MEIVLIITIGVVVCVIAICITSIKCSTAIDKVNRVKDILPSDYAIQNSEKHQIMDIINIIRDIL